MTSVEKKAEKICEELEINVLDAVTFELDFENSLDHFKDLKQGEHQKIIQFIEKEKTIFANYTNEVACIKHLYDTFSNQYNSVLSPVQVKAAVAAGYYLIILQK